MKAVYNDTDRCSRGPGSPYLGSLVILPSPSRASAVEQTFLRFQAARAREEAVRRADEGDFDGAAASLRDAVAGLAACAAAPGMAEEMDDLEQEARRLQQRLYESSDRKYHAARAMANRESKADYAQRVSRRRPKL